MASIATYWFKLVNEQGDAYGGSSVTYVELDSTKTIAYFLKAVKNEFSNTLSSVDAGVLKAYKDETAFSKGESSLETSMTLCNPENPKDNLGRTAKTAILVLLTVSSSPQAMEKTWLVEGTVQGDGKRGFRKHLYSLGDNHLAYTEADICPFKYNSGKILEIHILFVSEIKALEFDSQLRKDTLLISPMSQLQLTLSVRVHPGATLGKRIYSSDYVPDKDSPPDSISVTTLVPGTSPLYQYQRIEKESMFGHMSADRCHLIDKAECKKDGSEYTEYLDDENNMLAMSKILHYAFDGINCDFPLFKIDIVDHSRVPVARVVDNRYQVKLQISAFDEESARLVFPLLKEGSSVVKSDLVMETDVYVKDIKKFKTCVEWKSSKIESLWNPEAAVD